MKHRTLGDYVRNSIFCVGLAITTAFGGCKSYTLNGIPLDGKQEKPVYNLRLDDKKPLKLEDIMLTNEDITPYKKIEEKPKEKEKTSVLPYILVIGAGIGAGIIGEHNNWFKKEKKETPTPPFEYDNGTGGPAQK